MFVSLDNFVWNHPEQATALFTLIAVVSALVFGIPTLLYLARSVRITGEAYEASVMPLLVAEFGSWQLGSDPTDAVLLRNIGKGPALGVQFAGVKTAAGTVAFDYIPLLEPGGSAPLVCVGNTPMPPDYPTPEQRGEGRLRQYARWYVLKCPGTYELKVAARSLSNTLHTFRFNLELRGSDHFAVLAYRGRRRQTGSPEWSHMAV